MDIFNESRVNRAIQSIDAQATNSLNSYVNDKKYRNPDDLQKLLPGVGGSGGKMIIKIKYIYSALNELQRIVNIRFEGEVDQQYSVGPIVLYSSILKSTTI